jgi:hypothetical protein
MKLILLILLVGIIKSDIPTHCLKSQVTGRWRFHLTEPHKKDINGLYQHTCGHNLPSHESSAYKATLTESQIVKSIIVDLRSNNEAYLGDKVLLINKERRLDYGLR